MRVGNQPPIANLLAYHASQRQQRVFQNLGDRAAEFGAKRTAGATDTFSRSTQRISGTSAQTLRSEAPNPTRAADRTTSPGLTSLLEKAAQSTKSASIADQLASAAGAGQPETAQATAPTYSQGDIEDLLKLWGTVEGDDSFDPTKDMNADGKIDADDLNHMLANFAEPEPEPVASPTYTQDDVDHLLRMWGTAKGDEEFDEAMDMNADGKIDADDLNHMLSNFEEPDAG